MEAHILWKATASVKILKFSCRYFETLTNYAVVVVIPDTTEYDKNE